MPRDASNAWLLGAQPHFARLDVLADDATVVSFETLDDSERATANFCLQKAV